VSQRCVHACISLSSPVLPLNCLSCISWQNAIASSGPKGLLSRRRSNSDSTSKRASASVIMHQRYARTPLPLVRTTFISAIVHPARTYNLPQAPDHFHPVLQ
jgi:hypothetical protein